VLCEAGGDELASPYVDWLFCPATLEVDEMQTIDPHCSARQNSCTFGVSATKSNRQHRLAMKAQAAIHHAVLLRI
jgi:hypothetical protein